MVCKSPHFSKKCKNKGMLTQLRGSKTPRLRFSDLSPKFPQPPISMKSPGFASALRPRCRRGSARPGPPWESRAPPGSSDTAVQFFSAGEFHPNSNNFTFQLCFLHSLRTSLIAKMQPLCRMSSAISASFLLERLLGCSTFFMHQHILSKARLKLVLLLNARDGKDPEQWSVPLLTSLPARSQYQTSDDSPLQLSVLRLVPLAQYAFRNALKLPDKV